MNSRLLVTASLLPLAAVAVLAAPMLAPAPSASVAPSPPAAPPAPEPPAVAVTSAGGVHVEASPDRDLVFAGDRQMRVKLDWWADEDRGEAQVWPTDLVVVLDRSGSMAGTKLADAKAAARALVSQLGPDDRFTLVSFASDTRVDLRAVPAGAGGQRAFLAIDALQAGGGTEMVAGLAQGLQVTDATPGYVERMVLISDGLPNGSAGLHDLAVDVLRRESALTAIGIGDDYDEALLQGLADAGGGSFYWARQGPELEQVLAHELSSARRTVASAARLRATGGARIVDAGGLRPGATGEVELGTLFAGQRRSVWVTLEVPAGVGEVDPGALELTVVPAEGDVQRLVADLAPVALTDDAAAMYAALGDTWAESVVVDQYNDLRTKVSAAVQQGDQVAAVQAIEAYRQQQFFANAYAQNPIVDDNLEQLDGLVQEVDDNFRGPNAASKRNLWSKGTRSDAYSQRRGGSFVPAPAPARR
jgi:Ca-activated chloride channel homolog